MHRYTEELARHGVVAGQVLLTNDDMTRRSHYRNAYQTFAKLLDLGVLPIVNENDTVATTEIRFGDNDRLAALVAHLVHADLLVLLSDVDGLYDGDPADAGHQPGPEVAVRRRPGPASASAGPAPPASARAACTPRSRPPGSRPEPGIPVVLASAEQARGRAGRRAGRHPLPRHRPSTPDQAAVAGPRHRAPGHGAARRGRRTRDHAAARVAARRGHHRRHRQVRGRRPGRPRRPRRHPVARGLVNFDADEIPDLIGRSSHDLKRDLGAAYEREVVHRDDLVLLT